MEIKYKNVVVASFAALTLSVTSVAVAANMYQLVSAEGPAQTQAEDLTIAGLKKAFIKRESANKSRWATDDNKTNDELAAAIKTLEKYKGDDKIKEASLNFVKSAATNELKINMLDYLSDTILRAPDASYDKINQYFGGLINKEQVKAGADELFAKYYATNYIEYADGSVDVIKNKYIALSKMDADLLRTQFPTSAPSKQTADKLAKAKPEGLKEAIKESFKKFKKSGKKDVDAVSKSISEAVAEKLSESTDLPEASAPEMKKETLTPDGTAKDVVVEAVVLDSELSGRVLKISKVAADKSKTIAGKYAKAADLLDAFEIDLYAATAGTSAPLNGKKAKITIKVSEEAAKLLAADAKSAKLFHIHGDKNEKTELNFDFNKDQGTITFETDKFSEFALVKAGQSAKVNAKAPNSGYQAQQVASVALPALGLLVIVAAAIRLRK